MRKISLSLLTVLLISCTVKHDLAREELMIRKLLAQEREVHFKNDVDLFVSAFADSMIAVSKGTVKTLSPEQNKARITPYFNSVKFITWDDTEQPVIRFSDDGSLAYAVVQKQVILTYPDSLGKSLMDTTHYAWVSIYRKERSGWKVEANISTNK